MPKGTKLNLLEEGAGFRLPPKKIDGETVNDVAIVVNKKDENVTNNKYEKKIKNVKNEKIKKSLYELNKVFKEKWTK